ncbi:sugar ABC transporter ATP-binding protein [Nonomuraea sediminis]|uniref:sugar ABC transporter ATP-binding protein n=1 Tax=Nonomuraea sediminis TaxID=2835864 RepID=UPI001BDC57EA|nr:sugar ABC transporter ATP-binding protein [Nonomuraea sediminis]
MTFAVTRLSKTYGATTALASVSLEVRPGEVVGLIGTNGAGKSTLIKILSGVVRPTSGALSADGRPLLFASPLDAQAAGVQTVHQNIDDGVVFGTTVAENLVVGRGGPSWFETRARIRAAASAVAPDLGLPLDAPVESLPASARQQIVIARALARRARLLILDEPTSTLSAAEVDALVSRVRQVAASGVAVLYVSHRLSEIEALCDRVVVLRDGKVAGTFGAAPRRAAIVAAMLGPHQVPARPVAQGPRREVLATRGVRAVPGGREFGFRVRAGEILGVTGLVGSGKTELLEQLAGVRPLVSGELLLEGLPYRPKEPSDAFAAGVAFAAEERVAHGVVPGWSVRAHVTLPRMRAHSRAGLLSRRSESAAARRVIELFGVRGPGPEAPIESLSGGNQQKVVVGRWLDGAPKLLVLDEPFRGVDVGARADIGRVVRERAADMGVVVASSDPQELVDLADRVLVLHEGDPAGELAITEATQDRLAALMAGAA